MSAYVILTSKPGQFRTEAVTGLQAVESYEFVFFGQCKARFVIASVEGEGEAQIDVIDETPPMVVNRIRSKFLPTFDSVDRARDELRQLVRADDPDVSLNRT